MRSGWLSLRASGGARWPTAQRERPEWLPFDERFYPRQMAEARYPALAVRDRAASWAKTDDRVLVALVHGSVASGAVTELSDVDLVVVTKPGLRDAVWSDRAALSEQLLGAPVVEAHDVPHQRPYRWQARAANLCGLDLTLDDGTVDWWPGLAHEVTFLVDRSGAVAARAEWMTREREPEFDVLAADNETWALISWVAGCLLHGRTMLARLVLGDLVAARVAPVAGQPLYAIDGSLRDRFEPTLPVTTPRHRGGGPRGRNVVGR